MSAYQVAVLEDETVPTSGVAVIRIAGLKAWPQGATVRLRPVDEVSVPPQSDGWPWGELSPSRVIPNDDGIDIILGPDVVSSPRLVPGTPVTIEINAANVEADVRWPAIAPSVKRRINAVAMSAAQLVAARAERERAEKEAAVRRQQLAVAAALSVREATADLGVGRSNLVVAAAPPQRQFVGQLARLLPQRGVSEPLTSVAKSGDQSRLNTVVNLVPASAKTTHAVSLPKPLAQTGVLGFAAGAAAMAMLVGLLFALAPQWVSRGPTAAVLAKLPVVETVSIATIDAVFKDFASGGNMSPRRKSAANVDIATALSLADHSLRGQRTSSETEEAEFWLKRALGSSFGGADVGWALTQLGTLYAQSDSPRHSYAKAHVLWQLAAAQGDPMAHCFLGALYEHGLGVTASRLLAREHFLVADNGNGCRSAKDAVARLKD